MMVLRNVFYGGHGRTVRCSGHVHRNAFLALRSAQALKWASFISSFQAYFQELRHFSRGL